MAAVYAAHDEQGQVAAVKILHPEMCLRRDVRERFLREGVAANRIAHPGAVAVYEHGTVGEDCAFLVMELLEGETLGARLQRHGTLPVPQVLDVMDQVLDVLAVAHDRGIVHRDLKPDNLFIASDERIKVLDFGLARLLDAVPGDFKTRSGAALGTFPYMAPEQALGRREEIDGRADLFSLGATAFRILAQRKVHEADSDAELLMAMASKAAPSLRGVAPHVPAIVAQVIDVSLAFAKQARYPDARTMQTDVRAVRRGEPPPYATMRGNVQGAPTSVGVAPVGVLPTVLDQPTADLSPGSVGAARTEPLGVSVAAVGPSSPGSLPYAGASLSPEPTAPMSNVAAGSLPPVSGGAPISVAPHSAPSEMGKKRRPLVALVVGLAFAAALGMTLVAGGVALLFWRGSGLASAANNGFEANPDSEQVELSPPAEPAASGMAATEAPSHAGDPRPEAGEGDGRSLPHSDAIGASDVPDQAVPAPASEAPADGDDAKRAVPRSAEADSTPASSASGLSASLAAASPSSAPASAAPVASVPPSSSAAASPIASSAGSAVPPNWPRGRGRGHHKKR